jgi:hypothetical protein
MLRYLIRDANIMWSTVFIKIQQIQQVNANIFDDFSINEISSEEVISLFKSLPAMSISV